MAGVSLLPRVGLFLVITQLSAAGASADQRSPLLGQWSSTTLEGLGIQPDHNECSVITVTQRKVRLALVPGTSRIEGEWVRWARSTWMSTDNRRCRWAPAEHTFEPMLAAVWSYTIDGAATADGSEISIQGQYNTCDGNACERWTQPGMRSPFKTTFRLVNGRLVDTFGGTNPEQQIEFMRVSDEADECADAKAAVAPWLTALDHGDVDKFFTSATSPIFRRNVNPEQFRDVLHAFRSRVGETASRQPIMTERLLYAPDVNSKTNKRVRTDYVLIINGIRTSKGLTGGEYVMVAREGAEWKFIYLNMAS